MKGLQVRLQIGGLIHDFQNDLAADMVLLEGCLRFCGLAKLKGARDHHLDLALIDQVRDLLQLSAVRLRGVTGSANVAISSARLVRLLQRGNQRASRFHDFEAALLGLTADQVEHEVHRLNEVLEFFGLVIDHLIGAEVSGELFVGRRYSGCDPGALCLGELNGEMSDPAGATVDKNARPCRRPPWSKRPCQAVMPASGTAAAPTASSDFGFAATSSTRASTTLAELILG